MKKRLHELMTPCCVVDFPTFIHNVSRVNDRCASAHVPLRAHVKTLKSLDAAKHYAPIGAGITVSTVAEAEHFAQAGYRDILYAVGITSNKLERLSTLQRQGVVITVCLDSLHAFHAISPHLMLFENPLSIAIEIDCDGCRAGVTPESEELLLLAEQLHRHPQVAFWGLMTHAGGSYACVTTAAQREMATREVAVAKQAVERIERAGIPVTHVSVGSTPTVLQPIAVEGITELRAGVFATFDCVMAGLSVCEYSDIALSVLTRVIGKREREGQVIVDAGWMGLSRDYLEKAPDGTAIGYGLVCDAEGKLLPGWYVAKTNQEHGIIAHVSGATADTSLFAYDSLLRILPVHACATASQHNAYWVIDEDGTIRERWQNVRGW